MSTLSVSASSNQTISLPAQKELNKYVDHHSATLTAKSSGLVVSNILPLIGKYLAKKEISQDQIGSNITTALKFAIKECSDEDKEKLLAPVNVLKGFPNANGSTIVWALYNVVITDLVKDIQNSSYNIVQKS